MPSVVVALTLTRSISRERISRDPGPHRFPVRTDLGSLADQCDVAMQDRAALFLHQGIGMIEEFPGWRAFPASIRGRKMLADIAGGNTAQHRVGEGMQAGIGVGMAFQAVIMRHFHAAQPDMVALRETMRVIAHGAARFMERRVGGATSKSPIPFRQGEILFRGHFQIDFLARHGLHRKPRQSRRWRRRRWHRRWRDRDAP